MSGVAKQTNFGDVSETVNRDRCGDKKDTQMSEEVDETMRREHAGLEILMRAYFLALGGAGL